MQTPARHLAWRRVAAGLAPPPGILRAALFFCLLALLPALATMAQGVGGDTPAACTAQAGEGRVTGTVVDQSGAAIGAAQVTLADRDGRACQHTVADALGAFSFAQLPPGEFHISVTAEGFAAAVSGPFRLQPGQELSVPEIRLGAERVTTTVQVNARNEALATEQIHEAEKQRVLGLFPNYYTSFNYDAVPLTVHQKYTLAFHETFDPVRFAGVGVVAGIEQANNTFAGYGQGAAGYGKRYAAAYGDGLFADLLSHAVFPSLFHQDPRYFYQGTGTVSSRLVHAVSFAVIIRTDSGGAAPNYSYLLGSVGSGAISNLYYPHANRGAGLVFTNAAIGIGARAAGTVVREFLLGYITTHKAGSGRQAGQ